MDACTVTIIGEGVAVRDAATHPAGRLFSGGYDAVEHRLYLSSVMGHPRGVSLAGGDPSDSCVGGLRVLITEAENLYWTTDSMSLPRALSEVEADAVQRGLESHFAGHKIQRVEKLEDAPR